MNSIFCVIFAKLSGSYSIADNSKVGMTTFRLKTQRHGTFLSLPLVVVWIVGTFHALCTTHKQHLAIRVEKSHKSLTHRELSNGERG